MIAKKEIATKYIDFLEKGTIKELLKLFSENGMVDSPVYGLMDAKQFYHALKNDTINSELNLKGIFQEYDSNKIALYFNYKWTLKNNSQIEFDVVDIIEFNDANQITMLKIIYDTAKSSELINALRT